MKNNIRVIATAFISSFLFMIMYLTYLQVITGESLAIHPLNRRLFAREASIERGSIYDSKGQVLARTVKKDGKKIREYPLGSFTAHLIGYTSPKLGKTGLEARFDKYLLGQTRDQEGENFWRTVRGRPILGKDIILTLDSSLQKEAVALLGQRKGAVVVMRPQTGEVLAMATAPTYDPNKLEEIWSQISSNEEGRPLINRAVQGVYPPGSTLKVVTAAAVLQEKPELLKNVFDCQGSITVDGHKISDTKVHGQVDFNRAMAVSCNTTFIRLGLAVGADSFVSNAVKFGFNREIPFDIPLKKSFIPAPGEISRVELAESAIGQGKVLATPLEMALIASTIGNRGEMIRPRLVDEIRNHDGSVNIKFNTESMGRVIDPAVASIIRDAMVYVVESGTGTAVKIPGVKVAGKTGTAENPHGIPHAWFIGFAPAENPQVAVAVILENAGFGGVEAAPIAKTMIERVLYSKR